MRREQATLPTPATVRAEAWPAVAGGASDSATSRTTGRRRSARKWPGPTERSSHSARHCLLRSAPRLLTQCCRVDPNAQWSNVRDRRRHEQCLGPGEGLGCRASPPLPVVVGGGQVIAADDTGFSDNFGPHGSPRLHHSAVRLVKAADRADRPDRQNHQGRKLRPGEAPSQSPDAKAKLSRRKRSVHGEGWIWRDAARSAR